MVRKLASISKVVAEVVLGDPILRQCLSRRVVNYRKLAKTLQPVVSMILGEEVSVDAVKIALLRYSKSLEEERSVRREILEILARSFVELRTDITIAIIRSAAGGRVAQLLVKIMSRARFVAIMQSATATTLVLDRETAEELLSGIDGDDIIEAQKGQAAIVVVSPREIMTVPGILAYITNALSQHGINIIHIESCYTDTLIVVSKDDLERAFSVLVKHIEGAREMLALPNSQ
jgi:hypothetical protein